MADREKKTTDDAAASSTPLLLNFGLDELLPRGNPVEIEGQSRSTYQRLHSLRKIQYICTFLL